MKFEFAPRKSAANKRKHGIDFIDAQIVEYDYLGRQGTGL